MKKAVALTLLLSSLAVASKGSLPVQYSSTYTATSADISVTFDRAATDVKMVATGAHGLVMKPVTLTRSAVKAGEKVTIISHFDSATPPAAVALKVQGNFYGVLASDTRSFPVTAPVKGKTTNDPFKVVPVNVTH